MDEDAINKLGLRPVRPLIDAVAGLRDVRDLAAFLGEFERIGGHGLFGSYVDTDDRNSDRYLFHIVQGGLGLPDESYYREDKFAEIREKYVAYLTGLLGLAEHARPGRARRRTVLEIDTRLAAGPLGARRDPRRPEDLQPDHGRGAAGAGAGLRLGRLRHQPRRRRRDARRVVRPAAVVPRPPVDGPRRGRRSRTGSSGCSSTVLRSAAPYLTDEFVAGQLRLLRPHPQRHPRAARPLEARGRRWSRAAIGEAVGKEYVARHFPPESKALMDELVAQPARGLPAVDRRAGLDERGDQAAGVREARDVPAQDRLPREVPRLLRAAGQPRRPARQRRRRVGVRDRPPAAPRSARRSTATSGSCCRRPSTPTTTPAPTRSASRPASCRSRSSARTPTRPRTTAASAR